MDHCGAYSNHWSLAGLIQSILEAKICSKTSFIRCCEPSFGLFSTLSRHKTGNKIFSVGPFPPSYSSRFTKERKVMHPPNPRIPQIQGLPLRPPRPTQFLTGLTKIRCNLCQEWGKLEKYKKPKIVNCQIYHLLQEDSEPNPNPHFSQPT